MEQKKKWDPFVLTDIQVSLGGSCKHRAMKSSRHEAHKCMTGAFTSQQESPAGGHGGGPRLGFSQTVKEND